MTTIVPVPVPIGMLAAMLAPLVAALIDQLATGPQGPVGPIGASFLSGSGTPSNSLGSNGDTYLNTANGEVWNKSGGSWTDSGHNPIMSAINIVLASVFATLPTSDPHVFGGPWNNGGIMMVSAG